MPVCLPSQTGFMGSWVRMRVVFVLQVLWYAIAERGKRGWVGWYDSTVHTAVRVQVHALYDISEFFGLFFLLS